MNVIGSLSPWKHSLAFETPKTRLRHLPPSPRLVATKGEDAHRRKGVGLVGYAAGENFHCGFLMPIMRFSWMPSAGMIDNARGAGYTGNISTSLHNRKASRLSVVRGDGVI